MIFSAKGRAFHAQASQSEITVDGKISFGTLRTNVNGGYNPATSTFTCNDRNLYLIYVTMSSKASDGPVWYLIMQDSNIRARGFTGTAKGSVSSQLAMIKCSPGSQVWVKQGTHKPAWKQGIWAGNSMFGGFQITF